MDKFSRRDAVKFAAAGAVTLGASAALAQEKKTEAGKGDKELNEAPARVMAEASRIFDKMAAEVEREVKGGAKQLTVARIAERAGLKIDEKTLKQLRVPLRIYVFRWCHWCQWFPWQPLWCYWWHQHHPQYRCCPWWWHRCYYT